MARRIALLVFAVVLVLPGVAFGVWGGQPDGNNHPQVGGLYFDFDNDGLQVYDLVCSGSYAGVGKDGSDVFLTAGHCLPPPFIPAGALNISFDNNASGPVAPVVDPITATAYHQMPGFGHDRGDLRDLGVILLPAGSVATNFPSAAANPVQLPTAGYLDDMKRDKTLKFTEVDVVGYGVTPVWNEPGRTGFDFDGERMAGTTVISGLSKANVHYNQNPNGIGTGSGLCFGDSGSPQLEAGTANVLSVTSGGNGQCNSHNYNYRVDTPQAREFLGQFLNLP